MELCFVQLRLLLMPRSFLIDIHRWNYEYSKYTQTRRHDIYTTRGTECSKGQTDPRRKRPTWIGPQRIGLFRGGPKLLQVGREQPQQVQPSRRQSVPRLPLESQPEKSQLKSGTADRNRFGMVQLGRNNSASSHHSENPSTVADFKQRRNRRCHSERKADSHANQRLVTKHTVSNPRRTSISFRGKTTRAPNIFEDASESNLEPCTSLEVTSEYSTSKGTLKSPNQDSMDRLHSVGRCITNGVEMLDEELVQLLQHGQREAFTTLISKWQDRIFTFCYRQLGESALAEEAAQDVFVKVYTSIHSFRKESKFSTWLYRIATNHCINLNNRHHRRQRDHHQSFDEMHNQPAEQHTPLQQLERKDFEHQLQLALHQLPEEHRVLLILRDIQDCSYEEIAEITQLNIGTIKSRIHRGRHNLRQILQGDTDHE